MQLKFIYCAATPKTTTRILLHKMYLQSFLANLWFQTITSNGWNISIKVIMNMILIILLSTLRLIDITINIARNSLHCYDCDMKCYISNLSPTLCLNLPKLMHLSIACLPWQILITKIRTSFSAPKCSNGARSWIDVEFETRDLRHSSMRHAVRNPWFNHL